MKNLLRRLHLGGNADDSTSPDGSKSFSSSSTKHRLSFNEPAAANTDAGVGGFGSAANSPDHKPLSGFSNWINAAKNSLHPSSSSSSSQNVGLFSSGSPKKRKDEAPNNLEQEVATLQERESLTSASLDSGTDAKAADITSVLDSRIEVESGPFGLMVERPPAVSLEAMEEYELQVAMALSVSDDPEAADIEKAKQISLGSDLPVKDTSAEVLAYQYWKYNALDYDDKVVDGFYDVYGVVAGSDSSSDTMPALIDLQGTSVSDQMTSEVVLVNRATDVELVNLEQKALTMALGCEASMVGLEKSGLVQKIASIVVDHMGGPVIDADLLLRRWRENAAELRASLGTVVLPLGRLQVGLARHRALLFKVLADVVGIPCQLVKGRQYTGGSDAESFNIIKIDEGRAYIIDLMGAPGTLIPSDVSGSVSLPIARVSAENLSRPISSFAGSLADHGISKENKPVKSQSQEVPLIGRHPYESYELKDIEKKLRGGARPQSRRFTSHSRSPSWTEGIGSPAVNMKAKDASRYMMDAAKENPKLAQKLHDVLVESGVQAPPGLFTEVSSKQLQDQITEDVKFLEEKQKQIVAKGVAVRRKELSSVGLGRPSPTVAPSHSSSSEESGKERLQRLNSVEGLGERRPLELSYFISPNSSPSSTASSGAAAQSSSPVLPSATAISIVQESLAPEIIKHVPVAAAAAATAAVVASSMVVAAAKSDMGDPTLEVPVAAAATATAAVVVATSAVVGRRLELHEVFPEAANEESGERANQNEGTGKHEESPVESIPEGRGSGGSKFTEEERVSDKSSGSVGARYDPILDDVPEILWEDLVIGERIGLGSYGEVYRGEWHGTEVAVKKFLNQDISGAALEEFGSEVRLMKRMRHPNVVLFMGAVMRTPNLSIVTEFLPRGSLYRLIHRPNNQLDERRRMRMALDVARGMNYLHSSTPVIVHRDLKSPNLLVDKNWVVKVCDFGLSRMKHNTFLSSKSTAGTPEWMAPEVLRNEPSNEKSDVYSFGVILWELATLQQPWAGMNPMQVVGAVGFQYRCLDIPQDLDPTIARIIRQCWQSDPNARPSFGDIMDALKPLQRALVAAQQSQTPKS